MKKNALIRTAAGIVLLGIACRFSWVAMTSVSSLQSAQSPNQRYMAKVSSKWSLRFWGGIPYQRHSVLIESADGRRLRQAVTEEPWTSWPRDCSIQWSTNSSSVTFTFNTEESLKTHLILNVTPANAFAIAELGLLNR